MIPGRDAASRRESALRRRVEIRGSFWFHPDKTVRSRARRAREPEQRELYRGRGSRWSPPSRSRLVAGATQLRRTVRRVSGDSREARQTAAKNKKKFCFLRPSSDPILATRATTRKERAFLSLLVRRRSDSRFPTRGEVSSDGYSKRREGRSVLDPTMKTRVRAENFQALQKCDSVARASFRAFSVCSGYPASFFGPWLCACVWHESMLLSCVWRASRDRRVG